MNGGVATLMNLCVCRVILQRLFVFRSTDLVIDYSLVPLTTLSPCGTATLERESSMGDEA